MRYPDAFGEDEEGGRIYRRRQPAALAGTAVVKGWPFFDIELVHASAQSAAIKSKDF